ncbi:hypothetical protein [Candidatus Frankia alpina]|uniref:hypothetical protein n=1 Tax=Candidatus Frankia alpina TaxID=2699483 RepID=UPI001967DB07|nr:hypothetical protein [Candidatus Frankia alpina]
MYSASNTQTPHTFSFARPATHSHRDAAWKGVVAVLHAHAAALAWVRDSVGLYPVPLEIAAVLNDLDGQLRDVGDDRDPVAVLGRAAVDALAAYRAAAAA